ncbi:MAG: ECF transporter S component [Synergistaceae bacterium]|jgi:uncharacterized membrane protein|nr:ECF transporter S component [Synergistaceae bacterium]
MNNNSKLRDFALMSMFVSIIFIMTFSPIGFIPLPFAMNATIVHVPVIIGSIVLGPRAGAILGFFFGVGSLIRATISPTLLSFVFSPLIPFPGADRGSAWALLVCFVPRVLVGIVPYYADKFLANIIRKGMGRRVIPPFVAGIAGSMTNTILVMLLIFLIFGDAYARAMNVASELVHGMILTVVFVHGIPEALVAGIFTYAVCKTLDAITEKRGL